MKKVTLSRQIKEVIKNTTKKSSDALGASLLLADERAPLSFGNAEHETVTVFLSVGARCSLFYIYI